MDKIFLETTDFQNTGRGINFASIKNSNVVNQRQFDELSKGKSVYTETQMNDYIQKAADNSVVVPSSLGDVLKNIATFLKVTLEKKSGKHQTYYMQPQPTDDDVEKGMSLGDLHYSSDIKFKKTGVEIKEKLDAILGNCLNNLTNLARQTESIFGKICEVSELRPTQNIDSYETEGLDPAEYAGLKVYDYDLCYHTEGSNRTFTDYQHGEIKQAPSKMEADLFKEYNRSVRELIDCKKQKGTIDTFIRNLDTTKSYDLNLETIKTLKF